MNADEGKMMDEIERCLIYEPEGECLGTTGRKFRQVCVYCPMYERHYNKQKEKEKKDNVEKDN